MATQPADFAAQAGLARSAPEPATTPGIVVRDLRFNRGNTPPRWWLNGDPIATAWFTSLSATFPRGEAFFVEAVKAHRDGVPAELAEDIRKFVIQEVNHSREHVTLNRISADAGFDIAGIEDRVQQMMDLTKGRPPIINLAVTMALEHYTAMMANEFLSNPGHLAGSDMEIANLWRWHAIEEIEHKGVAYDTWLHATKDWSRWKRWKLKAFIMLLETRLFLGNRIVDTLALLEQQGISGWRPKVGLAWYLLGKPGVLRRIFPNWLSFFLPRFHPWNHDDRALIVDAAKALETRA